MVHIVNDEKYALISKSFLTASDSWKVAKKLKCKWRENHVAEQQTHCEHEGYRHDHHRTSPRFSLRSNAGSIKAHNW